MLEFQFNRRNKKMADERSTAISIGGRDFELLLTTKATKEIAKRYGGLDKLGDKLLNSENFDAALSEVVYLITLLANQPILIHNLRNKGNEKDLLTEDEVELLTTPNDLGNFKDAITEALLKGTKRNVESEEPSKNAQDE
jgi:hypothetical protein